MALTSYLEWSLGIRTRVVAHQPSLAFNGVLTLTKWPSRKAVDLDEIVTKYGAVFFRKALHWHLVLSQHSGFQLTQNQLEHAILYKSLPFTSVAVYHKLKFTNLVDSKHVTLDAIYVQPERQSKKCLVISA